MTWEDIANQTGISQSDINQYQAYGWDPNQFGQALSTGLSPADISEFHAAGMNPTDVMERFQPSPETRARQQMAAIDPQTEALRQQLAGSYGASLSQAGAPTAQQFRSYLDVARQVDPIAMAAREALGRGVSGEYALGSQLDAGTAREVAQGVRGAQAARGNVYGTPQLVREAMARGQMGEARKQQRAQNLASYLSSGIAPGDVAMNLYGQQQQQLRANQAATLGYMGSGQTPYQAGASYLNTAEQRAGTAAQGGPSYAPQNIGQQYAGAQFPQYGLNVGQQANQWYNSLAAYGQQGAAPQKNRTGSALAGAGAGALSGAVAGSALGPYGTVAGGIIGGVAGGVGGYYG